MKIGLRKNILTAVWAGCFSSGGWLRREISSTSLPPQCFPKCLPFQLGLNCKSYWGGGGVFLWEEQQIRYKLLSNLRWQYFGKLERRSSSWEGGGQGRIPKIIVPVTTGTLSNKGF
uniref:Uncharacterized protein n=1 Tax=Micrurus surinamensis TaxID=129470 RepID=A0A2D4P7L7_MICSU